jgi:arylsulfatase A
LTFSRREFIGTAAALPAAAQNTRPPNVVLVVADDLGYADVGCYGQRDILTPNIDSLARDGLRFTQAYAGSTVCAPSRCCLMTGRHTGHATVRGNLEPHVPLTPEETTIAQVFKQAGYRTGQFGKWGLGTPPDMHALPTRKGFDVFYGYLHQVHAHTYFPDMLWDNERESYIPQNFGGQNRKYSHDLITQRALKFIDDNHSNPFFLYAPFTPPHGRFEAPNDDPYSSKPWPPVLRTIASMITRLDASVGLILERLKRYNIERDTLVIFTSDNGPGSLAARQFESSGPLRGVKRDLYEGGIRIPLVARWPGRIAPGISEEIIAFWDFLPTAAELTGIRAPSGLDGISFAPALFGKPKRKHDYLYWEFYENGFSQAVRMGDWKAVRPGFQKPLELYNLSEDVSEKNNVAAQHPDVMARIEAILKTCRTESPFWKPGRAGRPQQG